MSIYKKLHEVKKEVGKISKDATNPFFKSKYFDINALLEHIEPIIQKNDLILLQPIKDGKVFTTITDIETGENIESVLDLPHISDPQKLGSAITYYRRYTCQSLLGLQAEDDDGNKASRQTQTDRKPSLTDDQYEKTRKATKPQIKGVLDGFRMTTKQRELLTSLL